MRSKLLFLIVLIVALAAFCTTASANLIPNADMEDPCTIASPTTTDPCDWWEWGSDRDGAGNSVEEYLNDKTDGTTNAHSWKMYGRAYAPGAADYANILAPDAPVEEGKIYYAGIWVKDVRPGGSLTDAGIEFLYFESGTRNWDLEHTEPAKVPDNGEYNLISGQSIPVPAGVTTIVIGFNSGNSSEYFVDDYYLDVTRPKGGAIGVHSPEPADGAKVTPPIGSFPSPITLKWTKYGGQQGDELVIDTVWWNAGSADCNENNFDSGKSSLVHTDPNTAAAVIDVEKDYYWRVDVTDPNGGNGGVETLIGPVWYFSTVNDPPDVDAGIKQAIWLDGVPNPVEFKLDATVSDDGLPVPPGNLTYSWTKTAGSGSVTFNPSSTVEDPCAVISAAADDYVLQLSVNDGSGAVTDTVKIRVYANGTTGLEARYDCDENSGAVGIHDDYSGYAKNPGDPNPPSHRGERMDNIGTPGMNATTLDTTGGHCADGGGPNQGAIVFGGGTGYVEVLNSKGEPNELAPGGAVRSWADFEDEVSVAAWVKIEEGSFNKNYQSIVCNGDTSWRLQQAGNNNSVLFNVNLTNDQGDTYTTGASGDIDIDDGTWHHVMGTYDGTKVALYIDGIEDASTETEGTINIGNDWLTFGQNLGWLDDDVDGDGIRDGDDDIENTTFEGVMDEIRIHSIGLPWRSDDPGNPEEGTVDASNARSVISIYRTHCGHLNCGGNYLPGDLDESCYVDMADARIMAEEWLDCSSIDRAFCDDFWK